MGYNDYLSGFIPEVFLLQPSTLLFIREDDVLVREKGILVTNSCVPPVRLVVCYQMGYRCRE